VRNRQADGVIIIGQGSIHQALDDLAKQFDVLSVWGAPVAEGQAYALVGSDNYQGGYLAGQHMARLGRSQIAFVGYQDHPEIASRFAGVKQALSEHGLKIDEDLVFGSLMDRKSGELSLAQLVESRSKIDAVIAASDMQAFKVMSALQSVGASIPDEIAVIGYDDIPSAAIYHPTLTTVRQDRAEGAEQLVENLLAILDGKPARCVQFIPELIIRESA